MILTIAEVRWIESEGNYVVVHSSLGSHWLRTTLAVVERGLSGYGFVRVHKSSIVNTLHVRQVIHGKTGDSVIQLVDGQQVRASRRFTDNLRAGVAVWL